MKNEKQRLVAIALLCLASSACETEQNALTEQIEPATTDLVWAVNVGGPDYTGIDGTKYQAEESYRVALSARWRQSKDRKTPFSTRAIAKGDIEIAHPIANGTYDITFHFAEPKEYAAGERDL